MSLQQTADRKSAKYEDIIERVRSSGYHAQMITLQVESRDIVDIPSFAQLKAFDLKQEIYDLLLRTQ